VLFDYALKTSVVVDGVADRRDGDMAGKQQTNSKKIVMK